MTFTNCSVVKRQECLLIKLNKLLNKTSKNFFEEISKIEMCDMFVFVVVENKKGEY